MSSMFMLVIYVVFLFHSPRTFPFGPGISFDNKKMSRVKQKLEFVVIAIAVMVHSHSISRENEISS